MFVKPDPLPRILNKSTGLRQRNSLCQQKLSLRVSTPCLQSPGGSIQIEQVQKGGGQADR